MATGVVQPVRRRGSKLLLPIVLTLLGVALLAVAVLFFALTSRSAQALLRRATPVASTVLENAAPSGWNLLDQGHLVVSYPTPQGTQTETIWLDSRSHARPAGTRIDVYYDPAQPTLVRTAHDENDPVPWAPLFLGLGFLGLVLLIAGPSLASARSRNREHPHPEPSIGADGLPTEQDYLPASRLPEGQPLVPLDGQPALTTTQARDALRTYRMPLLRTTALVLGLIALGAGTLVYLHVHGAAVMRSDQTTSGVALDGAYGDRYSPGWVNVEYTVDGQSYTEPLYDTDPGALPQGTHVVVYYDPADPVQFRTQDNPNARWAHYIYFYAFVFAFGLSLSLSWALIRLGRWRRWLRRVPWETWQIVAGGPSSDSAKVGFAELTARDTGGSARHAVVRYPTPKSYGADLLKLAGTTSTLDAPGTTVLLARGPGLRCLVLPEGGDRPLAVRLPRSAQEFSDWQSRAKQASSPAT